MIPIHDLLNKIKWDERENPADYTLFYYDRVEDKLREIKYLDIKKVEDRVSGIILNSVNFGNII